MLAARSCWVSRSCARGAARAIFSACAKQLRRAHAAETAALLTWLSKRPASISGMLLTTTDLQRLG